MPISKKDVPLIVMSSVILVAAGIAVAGAILFLTRTDDTGSGGSVQIGLASSIEDLLDEEGPYFQADPTGNNRSFWVAEENGEAVALVIEAPGRDGCIVDYRGRDETFVDCDGEPIETVELDRYAVSVSTGEGGEDNEGALLVDLDTVEPAPVPADDPATTG